MALRVARSGSQGFCVAKARGINRGLGLRGWGTQHPIEMQEQFTHHGHEGHLGRLTGPKQPLVEGHQHGIRTRGRQGCGDRSENGLILPI